MDSSTTYSLSIRCFSSGFSFSVQQGARCILTCEKNVSQSNFCEALADELRAQHLMNNTFRQVKFVISTPVFTLVPTALFREQDTDVWLQFVRKKISLSHTVCTDILERFGCRNVYEVPTALLQFIQKNFAQAVILHQISDLLQQPAVQQSAASVVLADVCAEYLSLAVLVRGKLQLANLFLVKTPEDIAYWVLNVYEQFALNQEDTICYWYSKINQEAKQLLSKYIKIEA